MSEYIFEIGVREHGGAYEHRHEEIVRCRDCKLFRQEQDGCWYFRYYEQGSNYSWHEVPADVEPDGFCAWGERRGE